MLPFARILEYGNIIESPYIKRIEFGLSSSFPNMILLSNGDAYIGGSNDSGQLGIGNKTNRLRTLIKITESNLKLISCSAYASMYITSKDKIFLSGDRSIQNNSGSASGYTSYTDVSSLFSTINIADIKKIVCDYNTIVLMNNGDLYGIGLNRYGEFGTGGTGYKTLTKIGTDVLDASCTSQLLVYMKNDGTVWGSGRNETYAIKSSDEGGVLNTNITSFHQMFSAVQEPILQVRISSSSCTAFTASTAYSYGNNACGVFGDNNTTTSNTNTGGTIISTALSVPCKRSDSLDIVYKTSELSTMYIGIDNKIYSTGYNYNLATGVGVSTSIISKFTEVPNVLITDKDILAYGMYNSYIGRKQNIILGCGNNSTSMSNDVYTNTFNTLTLPF